jgi:hypothetical protein
MPQATHRAGLAAAPATGAQATHVIIAAKDKAGLDRVTFKASLKAVFAASLLTATVVLESIAPPAGAKNTTDKQAKATLPTCRVAFFRTSGFFRSSFLIKFFALLFNCKPILDFIKFVFILRG